MRLRALLLLTLLPLPTRADERALDTLEWLTIESPVIVTGTIEIAYPRDDLRRFHEWDEVVVRVTRTLKGPPVTTLKFLRYPWERPRTEDLQAAKTECLFFLDTRTRTNGRPDDPQLRDHLFLHNPTEHIIPFDGQSTAYTCDFRTVRNPKDILAAVEAQVTQSPPPPPIDVHVPTDLWSRSKGAADLTSRIFRVPDDHRWRRAYIPNLLDQFVVNRRFSYGLNQRFFVDTLKCPQTIDFLRTTLAADREYTLRPADAWPRAIPLYEQLYFPRRDAAYRLLRSWHVDVEPNEARPALAATPAPPNIALLTMLPLSLIVLVLLPRRLCPAERARRLLMLLSLTLFAGTVATDYLTEFTPAEYLLATSAAEHEITVHRGTLHYLSIRDNPIPHPWQHLAPAMDATRSPLPHLNALSPVHQTTRLGVSFSAGVTTRPGFPYRLYTVPLWLPMTLFCLFPAAHALIAFARSIRRHLRRQQNLCPTCGYDLRHTPTRCPECGAARS
jgi:hypothetical protein